MNPALIDLLEAFPPPDGSHACAGVEPDLFFVPENMRGPSRRARVAQAQAICAACPHTYACLGLAEVLGSRFGVWGGVDLTALTSNGLQPLPDDLRPIQTTSTPEVPMPTIAAPERDALEVTTYVADMAGVLSRTEGHPDKLVRDLRKLAVQAIQALSTATATTNVSALTSRAASTPPGGASSPKAGADTPAAEVRAWARETGLDCPKFGRVPDSIRAAFAAAQGASA